MRLNIIGVLFAAGVGLAVANPAEAQSQGANKIAHKFLDEHAVPNWVLPALLIAGFAIGYGVRSLVSLWRRRRARRSRLTMTSHGLPKANTPQKRIVTRDELGAS